MTRTLKIICALVLAVAVSGTVSACGKKGQTIPPAGATYPQQYPR